MLGFPQLLLEVSMGSKSGAGESKVIPRTQGNAPLFWRLGMLAQGVSLLGCLIQHHRADDRAMSLTVLVSNKDPSFPSPSTIPAGLERVRCTNRRLMTYRVILKMQKSTHP